MSLETLLQYSLEISLPYKVFIETYHPKPNHLRAEEAFNGYLFNPTQDSDNQYVMSQYVKNIWTVRQENGEYIVRPGRLDGDITGYFVTEMPWEVEHIRVRATTEFDVTFTFLTYETVQIEAYSAEEAQQKTLKEQWSPDVVAVGIDDYCAYLMRQNQMRSLFLYVREWVDHTSGSNYQSADISVNGRLLMTLKPELGCNDAYHQRVVEWLKASGYIDKHDDALPLSWWCRNAGVVFGVKITEVKSFSSL